MRHFIFILITFVLSSFSWGQVVYIQFVDTKSGENIQNVNVLAKLMDANSKGKDSTFYARSSGKGIVSFKLENVAIGSTINLNCTHPIYEAYSKTLKTKSLSDTLKITLFLQATKSLQLKEIVVKAPGIPDTVFRSERLSVADFEVQNNGDILLLTYPKQLSKGSELVLYDGQQIITSFQVNDQAQALTRDYRGNTHVICKDNVFGVFIKEDEIQLGMLPKPYFMKYVAPILDTIQTKLFLSNFNKDYPAFEYYTFDQEDSSYRVILKIEDELMMEMYRAEYKWMDIRTKLWAKNKELETGIDAEIWVGANYFTQSIYYKEVYAPMFKRNDSIYVFNYPKDRLEVYNKYGECKDSIAIYHHYNAKQTGWQSQLIQDKITGVVYAIYEKTGSTYLGLIDLKTGMIQEKVKLGFRYVDKIRIHNNVVYYVYRPFESVQKKFLYKEKLPYTFKANKTISENKIAIGEK
ncbi:MAG: hypothetical protein FGM14_10755 [Flavobacteriales bacterium]|nr:hypothetical protein [Flavobacteriales bacterium]